MPVHKIQGGYQYGETGKKYYGKDAKKKAERQALAIRLSGYEETKSTSSKRNNQTEHANNHRTTTIQQRHSTNVQTSEELVHLGRVFVVRLLRKDH